MEGLSGRGDTGIRAGEYAFAPAQHARCDGHPSQRQLHSARRDDPRGWTIQQIYARLSPIRAGGRHAADGAEGTLLPETYTFTRGMTRAAMVDRMKEAQSELVEEIWKGRQDDLPVKDIGEFVTLASIVEKETGIASERPHVASVFVNRCARACGCSRIRRSSTESGAGRQTVGRADPPVAHRQQQPLQHLCDPRSSARPIANPGGRRWKRSRIRSGHQGPVFRGGRHGGHAFARTLNEHNANVRRYATSSAPPRRGGPTPPRRTTLPLHSEAAVSRTRRIEERC